MRKTVTDPRASPCQFHWLEHDRMSTRRFLRAIPTAVFFRRPFSCVLFVGCLAYAPRIVHRIDFGSIARIDGVAAKFAVGGEQPVLRGKNIADNREFSDLPIVWKLRIHGIKRGLNGCSFYGTGNQGTQIAASISDDHDLQPRRQQPRDFVLDRLRRNVMSGIHDDQILDAAADAPIPTNVYFALIASVEPSV